MGRPAVLANGDPCRSHGVALAGVATAAGKFSLEDFAKYFKDMEGKEFFLALVAHIEIR